MADQQNKSQNQIVALDAKLNAITNVREMFSIPDVKDRFIKNYTAVSGKKDGENRFEQEKFAYMEILNEKPELKGAPMFYHFSSIIKAGTTGLSFRNGRLYVIPTKDKDGNVVSLKVESSPAGKREMMENMKEVKEFPEAVLVMVGDDFVHDKMNNVVEKHKTTDKTKEQVILDNIRAAYQRIKWSDNSITDVVVYKEDLLKARSKSKIKSADAGVWNEFPGEACKKTATNRAFNRYYKNPDNVVEYGPSEDTEDVTYSDVSVEDTDRTVITPTGESVNQDTGEVTSQTQSSEKEKRARRAPDVQGELL